MSWLIASQIVQDNATGLRFEFDEGDNGATQTLRVFTKERTRVLVLMFQRDGGLIKSDVRGVRDGQLEDVGQAAFQELHQDPAVADAAARARADLKAHSFVSADGNFAVADPIGAQLRGEATQSDDGSVTGGPNTDAPKQQGVFYGDE